MDKNEDDTSIIHSELYQFNQKYLGDKTIFTTVYEKNDDNIVGGILTYSIDIEMLLDTLWVLKNYRNQGVGKNLVKSIEKTACYK